MNNSRRKRINDSIKALKSARLKLESALTEEKVALNGLPDDDDHEDMRSGMDDIVSGLEDTLSSLEEALNSLECADF